MAKGNKGFTLLEIIIVLALLGGIMGGIAHYAKKRADESARQSATNNIVKEIYGLLNFINLDEIGMSDGSSQINPLYNRAVHDTPPYKKSYSDVFFKRTSNHAIEDSMDQSNYLSWSGADSKRAYFTNSRCDLNGTDPTHGEINRKFDTDFIPCQTSINGMFSLDRIDFIGSSTDPLAMERIDFIVKYKADLPDDNMHMEMFKQAFENSFDNHSLIFKKAVYLQRPKNSQNKNWNVILINHAGKPSEAIDYGTMASYSDKMGNFQSYEYAVRFSFLTGVGKTARTDGSTGVDKVCWNINKQMTGPCLKAEDSDHLVINSGTGSTDKKPGICWDSEKGKSLPCLSVSDGTGVSGDDQIMQLTTDKGGQEVTGTLMANVIVENKGLNGTSELVTVPVIQYQAFGNNFDSAKKAEGYTGSVDSESGTLKVPAQSCPVAPALSGSTEGRQMYPRLAAAISSISADTGASTDANGNARLPSDFSDSTQNRISTGVVGRLGGVALQVNLSKDGKTWTVSQTSAVYDNQTGDSVTLINSQSLSVVLTSWCSTVKQ